MSEYTITVDRIEGDWVVLEVAQVDGHEITLVDVPRDAVPNAREGARYRLVPESAVQTIHIVMAHPPGPDNDLLEAETIDGYSLRVGEWIQRPDGYWAMVIERVLVPSSGEVDDDAV